MASRVAEHDLTKVRQRSLQEWVGIQRISTVVS
jgi:hypothetical protein